MITESEYVSSIVSLIETSVYRNVTYCFSQNYIKFLRAYDPRSAAATAAHSIGGTSYTRHFSSINITHMHNVAHTTDRTCRCSCVTMSSPLLRSIFDWTNTPQTSIPFESILVIFKNEIKFTPLSILNNEHLWDTKNHSNQQNCHQTISNRARKTTSTFLRIIFSVISAAAGSDENSRCRMRIAHIQSFYSIFVGVSFDRCPKGCAETIRMASKYLAKSRFLALCIDQFVQLCSRNHH